MAANVPICRDAVNGDDLPVRHCAGCSTAKAPRVALTLLTPRITTTAKAKQPRMNTELNSTSAQCLALAVVAFANLAEVAGLSQGCNQSSLSALMTSSSVFLASP
jgi:hypothetical protein